jgi:choline kinase
MENSEQREMQTETIKIDYNHSHCLWLDVDTDEKLRRFRSAIEQNASEESKGIKLLIF